MKFPNRIKELRESLGISMRELARRAGDADPSTLSQLENGKKDLRLSWMRRLAPALGVKPSELLADEDLAWRLTDEEAELLETFRKLPDRDRRHVQRLASMAAEDAERAEKEAASKWPPRIVVNG